MTSAVTLDQFRSAFRTGGFQSVSIRASGGEFFVTAQPRTGGRVTLATTHGKRLRAFRDAGKAIAVLHEIGAHHVQVDTTGWAPETAAPSRKRPDTAERQRRAHEAAAYDAWFRAEVEKAIQEADSPDTVWVSHEEAKRCSAIKRAEWRKNAAKKAAS